MKRTLGWMILFTGFVLTACNQHQEQRQQEESDTLSYIEKYYRDCKNLQEAIALSAHARVETQPIISPQPDVADDPAIWIHPEDRSKSTIIGTNKENGLHVYNLQGSELYHYPIGATNNVDVRYGFPLNGSQIDLAGCTNTSINGLSLMKINPENGALTPVLAREMHIDTAIMDQVYGFCLYKSPKTGKYFAFMNAKNGKIRQYELLSADTLITTILVREFDIPSKPEGMVADDEKGLLYVGEEENGIWMFNAEPDASDMGSLIFSLEEHQTAAKDLEGISIYYAAEGKGYILISSQGNFSYIVLDRSSHEYLFSFKVAEGKLDGIEDTDGLDVINLPMGKNFPRGFFVAQDGFNTDRGKNVQQNFKLVPWEEIAKLGTPPLLIDTSYTIRKHH